MYLCVPISPYVDKGLNMRKGIGVHTYTLWVQILVGFGQKMYITNSNTLKLPYSKENKTNYTVSQIRGLIHSYFQSDCQQTIIQNKQTNLIQHVKRQILKRKKHTPMEQLFWMQWLQSSLHTHSPSVLKLYISIP